MHSSERHKLNALSPIVLTLAPIMIVSNTEQEPNALEPIDVTELGIVMLFNILFSANA